MRQMNNETAFAEKDIVKHWGGGEELEAEDLVACQVKVLH